MLDSCSVRLSEGNLRQQTWQFLDQFLGSGRYRLETVDAKGIYITGIAFHRSPQRAWPSGRLPEYTSSSCRLDDLEDAGARQKTSETSAVALVAKALKAADASIERSMRKHAG